MRSEKAIVASLKACARDKDLQKGSRIHAEIVEAGLLAKNAYVGNTLVSMYAKCGELAKAHRVLDRLPVRDVVTWNALIAGYAQHMHGKEALNCFEQLQREGLSPNTVTFICILKACGSLGAIDKGKEIHDEIIRQGLLGTDIVLGTALVDMYAKCGEFAKAQKVLDELPGRDAVSWNALIAGYAQHEHGEQALNSFEQMQCEGLWPNPVTFICILKACGSMGAIDKGKQIHDEILKQGLLQTDVVLGNALVDMYAKCGDLAKAQQVLNELPVRDIVTWNTLIAGYAQHEHGKEALTCFELMQREGLSPDAVTFVCILKACGCMGAADKGKQIHDEIGRQGLVGANTLLGTALVDMYVKCGEHAKAQQVLDELLVRDVGTWNALIAGYAQQEHGEEALNCFARMQHEGLCPDSITFIGILKACGIVGSTEKGKQIHHEIIRQGLLGTDIVLGNALVDMYAKCGALAKAQQVLDELPARNVISWSALIAGYAQHEHGIEALDCFEQMQHEGLLPNGVTFICILKACGSMGATDKGREIHHEIVKRGLLGTDIVLGTALVDMYAKCGNFPEAQKVLNELSDQDVESWNALIAGYVQHEHGEEALNCFEQMQLQGILPNAVTITCVLAACSHSGLLNEGQMQFTNMSTKYGIMPCILHHTCMIDLFGRTGHFEKAIAVIKDMSSFDHSVWRALLGACGKYGKMNLGTLAFQNAVQVEN